MGTGQQRVEVVVLEGKPVSINNQPIIILSIDSLDNHKTIYLIQQETQIYELYQEDGSWYLGRRLNE